MGRRWPHLTMGVALGGMLAADAAGMLFRDWLLTCALFGTFALGLSLALDDGARRLARLEQRRPGRRDGELLVAEISDWLDRGAPDR